MDRCNCWASLLVVTAASLTASGCHPRGELPSAQSAKTGQGGDLAPPGRPTARVGSVDRPPRPSTPGHEAQPALPRGEASPWPMFHCNPRRTGVSRYTAALHGRLIWKTTLGQRFIGNPVVGHDGTVYACTYDDD